MQELACKYKKISTVAHSCNDLIIQSHGSNALHKSHAETELQIASVNVHIKHQNEDEKSEPGHVE